MRASQSKRTGRGSAPAQGARWWGFKVKGGWGWAAATALAVSALIFALRPPAVSPPEVRLTGLDPAIVEVVQAARSGVLDSPRSAVAWGRLGQAMLVYDFKSEAVICFAEAERLDALEPRWPYLGGLACFPDRAEVGIQCLERAVSRIGDAAAAPRVRLAQILAERGRVDEAERHFWGVLLVDPKNCIAALGLAKLSMARGQAPEALRQIEACLNHPATAKASHLLAATIHQRLGNPTAAEEATRQAAQLPNDPPFQDPFIDEASQMRTGRKAWLDHAQQLIRQGQVAEAEPLLLRTVGASGEFADGWTVLGGVRLRQRNYQGAEEALRRAVGLEPGSLEGQAQLGVAIMYQGRFQEAATCFREALRIQPSLGETHFNLGLCQAQLGETTEALDSFRTAIRFKPALVDAYLGVAKILDGMGKTEEAKAVLRQALQVNPGDPRAGDLLARLERPGVSK